MSALSGVEGYLFGGAIVLFFLLLIIEKKFPYMQIPKYELKASFKTNTGAFLINNVIMSVFSLSSLILVASNYSNFGLLGGMDDGPLKWILSFILFDFAVYVWHWLGHKYEFLWRFHKIHHSDKSYHVTTGLRFHVLDQALEVLVKCFCVILFGVPASIVVVCEVVRMFFVLFLNIFVNYTVQDIKYEIISPVIDGRDLKSSTEFRFHIPPSTEYFTR